MPKRIQRKRVKGWRKPDGAVYVGRGSLWGNPFVVGVDGDVEKCIALYRRWLSGEISDEDTEFRHELKARGMPFSQVWLGKYLVWTERLDKLRGKDLMCWCKEGEPCHADVLIELANQEAK